MASKHPGPAAPGKSPPLHAARPAKPTPGTPTPPAKPQRPKAGGPRKD